MGFRLPEKAVLLKFEGDYEGAEVRVVIGGIPFGDYLAFLETLEQFEQDWTLTARFFADHYLAGWNLEYGRLAGPEREGQPIPASAEGIMACDRDFALTLLAEWLKAVREPPTPFDASASFVPEPGPEPGPEPEVAIAAV